MAAYAKPKAYNPDLVAGPMPGPTPSTINSFQPTPTSSVAAAAAQAVAAPAKTAVAKSAPGAPLVNQGLYGEQQSLAQKAHDEAMAKLDAQRLGTFRQYGFNPDGGVDGNNTLGLYQQQRRQFAQGSIAAEDRRLQRGLGGTGLGAQEESEMRYDNDVSAAGLMRDYLGSLGENDAARMGVGNDLQSKLLSLRQQQLADSIEAARWSAPQEEEQAITQSMAPSSQVRVAQAQAAQMPEWEKALAARSQGLNTKYGIGAPAPKKPTSMALLFK